MGEAQGLAEPLKQTGVLALTDKRLLVFKKQLAIGSPKDLSAQWPLDQVTSIAYDKAASTLTVHFTDGTGAGLHVPSNQSPDKLAAAFNGLA